MKKFFKKIQLVATSKNIRGKKSSGAEDYPWDYWKNRYYDQNNPTM